MVRIVGVDIPNEKNIIVSLTYIYGIGKHLASKICNNAKINCNIKTKNLKETDIIALRNEINKFCVEGDLRREIAFSINRLKEINCYRGIRHKKKLPVRGQRTKTNARTRKGPRKTIANKKEAKQQG